MTNYRQILTTRQAELELLKSQKVQAEAKLAATVKGLAIAEEAREVLNNTAIATQTTIKEFIEEVVTKCLHVVFGDEYSLKIVYEIKRNKSEASIFIQKGPQLIEPDMGGGGVIDVAAFGLRIALWALAENKPQAVLCLDEPAKNVSRDKIALFGEMLKKTCEMLGLQVIMVSHDPALIESADKAFLVTQTTGISKVEVVC